MAWLSPEVQGSSVDLVGPQPALARRLGRGLLEAHAATPIGNVGDASARLRLALERADIVAAEDTRRARALAQRLGLRIGGRTLAYHEHNEAQRTSELIEAAQIDGASGWLTLRNVTIPMVMPSITICLFLTLANTFKMFDQNLALTNGAPLKQTEMAALSIYNTMYHARNQMGQAQAAAVIFFLIVAAIALVQLRVTRAKEVDA